MMGMERSKEEVKRLSDDAVSLFQGMNERNEFLEELVLSLISRKN